MEIQPYMADTAQSQRGEYIKSSSPDRLLRDISTAFSGSPAFGAMKRGRKLTIEIGRWDFPVARSLQPGSLASGPSVGSNAINGRPRPCRFIATAPIVPIAFGQAMSLDNAHATNPERIPVEQLIAADRALLAAMLNAHPDRAKLVQLLRPEFS